LYGEPGTGKDEFARFIHDKSRRSKNDFVAVNCAAFATEDLLLSELFGHVPGAFTDAKTETTGCFESANGGTIFLDEFGDLSARAQGAILEVLEKGTFNKVGDKKNKITVSVRIVAATNKNIDDMVSKGLFRGDLYGRLGTGRIVLPPLRDRPEDIVILAENFIKSFQDSADGDKRPLTLSREAKDILTNMNWSNNVRSLKATIELTCGMFNTNDKNEGQTIIKASDLCIAASEHVHATSNDSPAERKESVDFSSKDAALPAQFDLPNELTLRDIAGLLDRIQLRQELDGTKPGDMILLENAYINLVKRIIDKAQDRKGSMIQALSFLAGEDLGELSYLSTAIHKRIESKLRLFKGLKTPEQGRKPRGRTGNKKQAPRSKFMYPV